MQISVSDIVLSALPKGRAYIRQAELIKLLPFSAATLWRKVKDGSFPKPIKLSVHITAWRVADIAEWMAVNGRHM